jgi:hypothetical protein
MIIMNQFSHLLCSFFISIFSLCKAQFDAGSSFIKFVSDLHHVNGFLRMLRSPNTNKTDHHDIAEILLQVVLIIITTNRLFIEEGFHRFNDAASGLHI